MVDDIRWTFLEILPKISWMDSQTRQQVAIRAQLMLSKSTEAMVRTNMNVIYLFEIFRSIELFKLA
jgi:hypothetical protein